MSTQTWEASVEKARLASLKTFEGRIEAALASFEQIPRNSSERGGKLAQFAEDADMHFDALVRGRTVVAWLNKNGKNLGDFADILAVVRSYSLAVESKAIGNWKNGAEFAKWLEATPLPTSVDIITKDGVSVYDIEPPFKRWTVDALRIANGLAPTNSGNVRMKLRAGETVTEDEILVADAKDHLAAATEDAEKVESYRSSREILNASKETEKKVEEEHHENVHAQLTVMGPDETEEERKRLLEEMQDAFSALGLSFAVRHLIHTLDELGPWMEKWGHIVRHEGNATEGELMGTRLNRYKADIDAAFERALGIDSIEEGFARLLADS